MLIILFSLTVIYTIYPVLAGKYKYDYNKGKKFYPEKMYRSLYQWSWRRNHPNEEPAINK